jgi:hypothetical protein
MEGLGGALEQLADELAHVAARVAATIGSLRIVE